MIDTYKVTGMTCSGCETKVRNLLAEVRGVKNVAVNKAKEEAVIEMTRYIPANEFQSKLDQTNKYHILKEPVIHQNNGATYQNNIIAQEENKTWLSTYFPILLLFGYLLTVTLLLEWFSGAFQTERWMSHFMSGFFLVFSFFKFLDLQGFANSYSMYDIIAKRWKYWGFVYAFIELALGIAFLIGFDPLFTNAATFIVMSISIIGVVQSVMAKRKIQCACLGTGFNIPMSTITIIEDSLMIGMSLIMLGALIF